MTTTATEHTYMVARWAWAGFDPKKDKELDMREVNSLIKSMGEENWDLVSLVHHPTDSYHCILFFKRFCAVHDDSVDAFPDTIRDIGWGLGDHANKLWDEARTLADASVQEDDDVSLDRVVFHATRVRRILQSTLDQLDNTLNLLAIRTSSGSDISANHEVETTARSLFCGAGVSRTAGLVASLLTTAGINGFVVEAGADDSVMLRSIIKPAWRWQVRPSALKWPFLSVRRYCHIDGVLDKLDLFSADSLIDDVKEHYYG